MLKKPVTFEFLAIFLRLVSITKTTFSKFYIVLKNFHLGTNLFLKTTLMQTVWDKKNATL